MTFPANDSELPTEFHDLHAVPSPGAAARTGRRRPWLAILLVLGALGALVVAGVLPRLKHKQALDARSTQINGPSRVAVVPVRRGLAQSELVLPGTALPAQSTVIYARLDGFVERLEVDLGDQVREGRPLALLSAPELEADLARARARLAEVEQNLTLSRASAERHKRLAASGISSQEAADEAQARANSADAALGSNRAEVDRLSALFAYRRVLAPFDGVITRRSVDRGALARASTTELFEIAQIRTLKVFVDVPQTLAPEIQPGLTARVFTPEAPDRIVEGKVVRTARALDTGTRTLRTEIHLPNDGALLAGAFVRVRLQVQRAAAPLLIPANALITRKEGPRVAVVDGDRRVRLRPVTLGRDLGTDLELLGGVAPDERVVLSPPDDLAEGAVVNVAPAGRDGRDERGGRGK